VCATVCVRNRQDTTRAAQTFGVVLGSVVCVVLGRVWRVGHSRLAAWGSARLGALDSLHGKAPKLCSCMGVCKCSTGVGIGGGIGILTLA
jgi:hypothetical protein